MRRSVVKKLVSVLGTVAIMAVLMLDGNACCPYCEGCDDNWVCAAVILSEISGCCGTGSGVATCKSDATFCVRCQGSGTCNCGGGPE